MPVVLSPYLGESFNVGVSRNTISSIETGQYTPSAKLALILCTALDKRFEDVFYF